MDYLDSFVFGGGCVLELSVIEMMVVITVMDVM